MPGRDMRAGFHRARGCTVSVFVETKGGSKNPSMAGLSPAIYFPYIDLETKPLWELLLWFRKLVILQPAFSCPSPCTEQAQQLDWVVVKRPLALSLNNSNVKALLGEWERLGHLYQESGYLRYLQHAGTESEEEPVWSLARKIREYGSGGSDRSPEEETLRGQLLLQLAQDLERQRSEIQEELADLEETQARMLVHLGVEEADLPEWMAEPLPDLEKDDFLIPQRVKAWAEMLAVSKEGETLPLLTPNGLVLEHLLEQAMERVARKGGAPPMALMQLELPLFSPFDVQEASRMRNGLQGLVPWEIFCEKMESFLEELRGMEAPEIQASLPRARALASYFQQEVRDPLVERVTAMEPRWKEGWSNVCLQVVVLPGWDAEALSGRFLTGDRSNLVIMQIDMNPKKAARAQREKSREDRGSG